MPEVAKTVGRYEILREVGRGGMAMVYLARQTDLDRFVALKELGAFHASDPSFAQRFLRESRVAGSLSHPNIVTVHDYFEHDGTPYIAMEYVERGSLRPHVGRMSLAQIGGVMEGLLAGLAHAESHGIVHRDLKPENLMVTADGRVKIADFGIAKATTKMQTGAFLTATGTTVGTPTYMAPEQAMAQDIGPWTDLYSVGCMAFELFTGRVPFHDSDAPMAILLRHVNEPIPPVKSIDPAVDAGISDWIERLLVKEPAKRTQSANDAWDEFEEHVIRLLGPRWRREARLLQRVEEVDTPKPLTPAPFEGTNIDGGAVSDEFQSFAWGTPGADTGDGASVPMYTPPPSESVPSLPEPVVGPPTPEPSAVVPAPPKPEGPVEEPPAPVADSGFLTFGAPAPSPPTDALVPPPVEAAAAAPVEDAGPPAADAAPPLAEAAPAVAHSQPAADAAPPAAAPAQAAATPEPAFETYVAPPPPRPPTDEPPAQEAAPPAPVEPEPVPVAAPEPQPVAAAEPEPEPDPATVMPQALGATAMPQSVAAKPAAAATATPEEPKRRRALPFVLVGLAVAAIAVIAVVAMGGGGSKKASSNKPATASTKPAVPATGAGLAVKVPVGWVRLTSAPTVTGVTLSDPVAMAPARAGRGVLFGRADSSSHNSTLLPKGVLAAVGKVPPRSTFQIADGGQAYRYADVPLASGKVTLFEVPTTTGVATLACTGGLPAAQCDAVAKTLQVTAGQALPVGPTAAYRARVAKVMGGLASKVRKGRAALKAKTPQAQAKAAAGLTSAYGAAAKSLLAKPVSPIDQDANGLLATALKKTSAAYRRAATAARHKNAAGFRKQSAGVVSGQRAVAGAVRGLKAIGYTLPAAVNVPGSVSPLPPLGKVKKPKPHNTAPSTGSTAPPSTGNASPPPSTNTSPPPSGNTSPPPSTGGGGGGTPPPVTGGGTTGGGSTGGGAVTGGGSS